MEAVTQGMQASAGAVNEKLTAIETSGTNILSTLDDFKTISLLQYQNRQSYINSKRVLASRVPGSGIPISISSGDFLYIDQGLTTGSLRGDSGGCTSREKFVGFETSTTSSFKSSTGDISSIDSANTIFQVVANTIPTGQFDVTLLNNISANIIIFDIIATPGSPTIKVSVSKDGITYIPFPNVSINGYRVTACGPQSDTKYVRISTTPQAPDLLNGISYSFGLTSLTVRGSSFALRSQFCSRPISFNPLSANLYFGTDDVENITYYISLSATNATLFTQYSPNSKIPIPGTTSVNQVGISVTSVGGDKRLVTSLPANTYIQSLRVTETISGVAVNKLVVPNLSATDSHISSINNEYVVVSSGNINLLTGTSTSGRLFNISYCTGPTSMNLILKAVLDTSDIGTTPLFRQAYFEAV